MYKMLTIKIDFDTALANTQQNSKETMHAKLLKAAKKFSQNQLSVWHLTCDTFPQPELKIDLQDFPATYKNWTIQDSNRWSMKPVRVEHASIVQTLSCKNKNE